MPVRTSRKLGPIQRQTLRHKVGGQVGAVLPQTFRDNTLRGHAVGYDCPHTFAFADRDHGKLGLLTVRSVPINLRFRI